MALRTKLFWRLTVLASVAALILSGAAGFYVYRKARVRAQYFRWRADGMAAAGRGDAQTAVDLLGQYLQRYPDDSEALAQFAHVRTRVGPPIERIRTTINVLRHLLKLEPRRREERQQLLDLYVQVHYWAEAKDCAELLLSKDRPPTGDDVPALAGRTRALIGLKQYSEAMTPAAQWSKLAPADVDAQFAVLGLLQETQKFDEFWRVTQTKAPTTQTAWTPQGQLLAVSEVLAAAARKDVAPGDPRPKLIRSHALALVGQLQPASDLLRTAAGSDLPDRHVAEVLMDSMSRLGLWREALGVLKRQQQREPNDVELRDRLVRRLWEVGDAQSVCDVLQKLDPAKADSDSEMLALRCTALLQAGHPAEAAAVRRALASRQDDPTALAWTAVLDLQSSKAPIAAAAAQQIVTLCQSAIRDRAAHNQNSACLSYYLAEAYIRLGDVEQAVDAWRKAAGLSLTWATPLVRMADVLADSGRYDTALEAAQEASRRDPRAAALTTARLYELLVQQGRANPQGVLALVDDLATRAAGRDQGQLLWMQVDLLVRTGKSQDAIAKAIKALDDRSVALSENSLLLLADVCQRQKLPLVERCLSRCEADHGVTPALAYAQAVNQKMAGRDADGLKLLEADRDKAAAPQSLDWRIVWARYLDLVQDPRAGKVLADLANAEPNNLHVQQLVIDARSTRDDGELVQRALQRVRELTGEQGVAWRLDRARWLLRSVDRLETQGAGINGQPAVAASNDADKAAQWNQEAAKLLSDVVRLSPDLLEPRMLLGRALVRQGRIAEALEQVRLATTYSPKSAALGIELARLLELHGEFDAARDELNRVRSMPAADLETLNKAALLAVQAGDPQLGLDLAQKAAGANGSDLVEAQLFWLSGKPQEAETACRRLLEKPNLSIVQFAADLFASQGRLDEAERALAQLDGLKLAPGTKELVRAHYASQYVGATETLKYLQQAVAAAPTNPSPWRALMVFYLSNGRPDEASATLTRALGRVAVDSAADLRALQQHSELFAAAADPELKPLVVAFATRPSDAAVAKALAEVWAARSAKPQASPEQLAGTLRDLAGRYPRLLPLQLLLAASYDKAGRWDDAIAAATQAAQQFPSAAEPQAALVALLRKQNRWAEVLTTARRWRQLSVANPAAADLEIAQACLALKQPDAALQQLEAYLPRAKANPLAYERVLTLEAMARVAKGDRAVVELMEPLLGAGPAGRAAWMGFAVYNLRPHDAADWLDRAEHTLPADADAERVQLAQMWEVLGGRDHDPQWAQKARAILKPLLDRPEPLPAAVLAMAMRDDADGDFQNAQKGYRRALAMTPNDIVAKNNLAMLLARSGGNLNEAAELVDSALKGAGEIAALYDTRAFVQGKLKKYAAAETSARQAIKLQPENAQYRVTLAQLQLDGGNAGAAAQTLRGLDDLHLDWTRLPEPLQRQVTTLRAALKDGGRQASVK